MPHGTVPELSTARLRLRAWRDEEDQAPFAALNADAQVNAYLLDPFTRERSDAQIASFKEHFAQEGVGRWAVELRDMVRQPADDFDHPLVPAGHRLQRHVLYRLARETWAAARR